MKGIVAFLLVIIVALLAVIAWELHLDQDKEASLPVEDGIPVFKISELRVAALPERTIKIDGGVIYGIQELTPTLRFLYADPKDPSKMIRVVSRRNPPENFRVGAGANIEGVFEIQEQVFKAYSISIDWLRVDPVYRSNKTKITSDMKTIYNTAKIIYTTSGGWPESIEEMVDRTDDDGNELEGFDEMPKDPWGNEYEYEMRDGKPVIICLGRDANTGGEGDDQDYEYPETEDY